MPDLLAVVRGLLPGRWRPSTRKILAVKDIDDAGTITPAKGHPRAVLRLPAEGLDGTANAATLFRLAAAVTAGTGRATLLAKGRRQLEELRNDPAWSEAWQRRVAAGRGYLAGPPRVAVACVVCGADFEVLAWRVRAGQCKTCGSACANEVRRRTLAAHRPAHDRRRPGAAGRGPARAGGPAWTPTRRPTASGRSPRSPGRCSPRGRRRSCAATTGSPAPRPPTRPPWPRPSG